MKKLATVLIFVLGLTFACSPAFAQDFTGQWQGVLQAGKKPRMVLKIAKTAEGVPAVEFYSIDESAHAVELSDVSHEGSTLKFSVPQIRANYEGVFSADGESIKGSWTQGLKFQLDFIRPTKEAAWPLPPSHAVQFVTTPGNVKLEVIDWGGTGRPLLLLAGLGGTAHGFDLFAAKLTGKYHVYGVTRRGFGASDKPDVTLSNFMSDKLADDVLGVIDALKLERPVLAGFSLAGQELSSIASRHPGKVAGLIYLDAAYGYSFYAPANQVPIGRNLDIEVNDLREKITRANGSDVTPAQAAAMIQELLRTDLPRFEAELLASQKMYEHLAALPQMSPSKPDALFATIIAGAQKYTDLKGIPILAIFASPGAVSPTADEATRAYMEVLEIEREKVIREFQQGNPTARIVRLPHADHAVFVSHPADVLREMTAFIDGLKE